jgi:hypothetical protein
MEAIGIELVKQVPSLGVLCFIVWVFIKHLGMKDDAFRVIHRESMEARELERQTIKENATALKENTVATSALQHVIDQKLRSNHQ